MIAGWGWAPGPSGLSRPVCTVAARRCEPQAESVPSRLEGFRPGRWAHYRGGFTSCGGQEQSSRTSNVGWLLVFLAVGIVFFLPISASASVTITRTNYHGWLEAYVVSNGKAEAVVVPVIGRVMQFGFVGEEGVFWENRALDGRIVDGQPLQWSSGQ